MSDRVRDVIATTIGDALTFVFGSPAGIVGLGIAAVLIAVVFFLTGFPMRTHRWCKGKGHWGIGPFRRRCQGCSATGLVRRGS